MSAFVQSRRLRCILNLQPCDDRIVPSTVVDMTTRGAQDTANGAIFQQCDAQPTGTGFIRSFVRVQANGVEQGYNTDARPLQLNENKSPQFTRSLTLGEVPVVEIDGERYREFLLDINQKASSPLLSLDELRIYAADTNVLSGYDALAETLGGYSPLYDLDSAGDVTVKLNYRLNSGSGSGDVLVLIPDSAFDGQPADSFVYLYSKFGCNYKGNAGFEEWAVRTPSVAPTGPGSLSGYVYFDANKDGDRDTGELGFGGIRMQLQQTNALGEIVVLDEVTTNTDGFYSFPNLQPGTYSIVQIDEPTVTPDGNPLLDGVNSIGTLESGEIREFDGVTADGILNIVVGVGQNGENYNFGEVEDIPN